MAETGQPILILTNVPDADTANAIGRQLVEQHVAACVNCLPHVRSIYRWEGTVEEASEVTLLIKTVQACYARAEALITELHPYDLPEIIVLPIARGLPAYLRWIEQEVKHDETR